MESLKSFVYEPLTKGLTVLSAAKRDEIFHREVLLQAYRYDFVIVYVHDQPFLSFEQESVEKLFGLF